MKSTEAQIAKAVIEWLHPFEVWQEVEVDFGRCDIVADVGGYAWVIETKTSFSLSLLEQAIARVRSGAKRVSVAIPKPKREINWFGVRICRDYGIGLITVDRARTPQFACREVEKPRFFRSKRPDPLALCKPEHKTFADAGTNGSWFTPFKATVAAAEQLLSDGQSRTIQELVSGIAHHYKSDTRAIASLRRWIDNGVIDTICVDKSAKPFLYRKAG